MKMIYLLQYSIKKIENPEKETTGDDADIFNYFMMASSKAKSEKKSTSIDQELFNLLSLKVIKFINENGGYTSSKLSSEMFKDPKELLKIKIKLEEKREKVKNTNKRSIKSFF